MFSQLINKFGLVKSVTITALMISMTSLAIALVINFLIGRQISTNTFIVSTLVPFIVSFPFLFSHFSMYIRLLESEKMSKKGEENYRNLISNIPGIVFQRDSNWRMRIISENKEFFGYTEKEINQFKKGWLEIIHPEDIEIFKKNSNNLSSEKDKYSDVYRIISKNNDIKWVQEWKDTIVSNDEELIGTEGIIFDITRQHNLEESLSRANKLESVGILAGGIAHDFNNILAAILGNINLSLFDSDLKNKTKGFLLEAEKASLRAKNMTQQLLTFSKGGDPVKETSSLENVIKDSANFILHGQKVACNFVIPNELWLVDIDKGQIGQVIQNIAINASHAMPDGGIINITCENLVSVSNEPIPADRDGRFVKISIRDNGIGMTDDVMRNIFDPYFSTKHKGSGLGLAITQSIISKHNGYITVESSQGLGSTFNIYLPASAATKVKKHEPVSEEKVSSCQGNILIMDDEEQVRTIASEMLKLLGHDVVCATDGKEAVRLFKESMNSGKIFDLIILDLTIPGGMGGKETVQEILSLDPNAQVIVSSGYSNDPILANYKDYGFSSAIAKPYQLQDLSRVINQFRIS